MPTANINGMEMQYLDQGEGFPLLFGHGYLWDSRMWAPQLDVLSEHFRCIVPDLWGHGGSQSDAARPLDISALADDHHALMQQLGIDRYGVIGSSIGVLWGARLAIEYPEEVVGLVMLNGYLGEEPAENVADYEHLLDIVGSMGSIPGAVMDALSRMMFCESTFVSKPALVETYRFDMMTLTPEQIATAVAMGKAMLKRRSQLDRLEELRCPVSIIVGDSDVFRPVAEARHMHSQMPGSELTVIKNAGHISNLEQDRQVSQVLVDYLKANPDIPCDADRLVLI
ncbi:alpha/beta fold hydrolase [Aliamphritea hakodatensis]|uniref:alpha/beta fold hydrolase n=1 Tax=Aliamphritea hakodatensis TaxID=2895352 RepID=UPI0022FD51FE|nr:alpha/beta hydrolase [Aliamphritea hakodatensis]